MDMSQLGTQARSREEIRAYWANVGHAASERRDPETGEWHIADGPSERNTPRARFLARLRARASRRAA
jgi:hypothetical protein